jgi:glucokinase
MFSIGVDLGGTKISSAIFDHEGAVLSKNMVYLANRGGEEVGGLIKDQVIRLMNFARENHLQVSGIGISVPGISYPETGRVWAPNIAGWDDYPLYDDVITVVKDQKINITIDSDRACSILGEVWKGKARGCKNVISLLVGTGIGAGIMVDGEIVRGHDGAAGAIGWLALDRPFRQEYTSCGCFEYWASGNGIATVARESMKKDNNYNGILKSKSPDEITSHDVFTALGNGDAIARKVLDEAIEFWGMTVANLVSLFNPEKIIFSGGVFGPALSFLDDIYKEALKWAQPVSIKQVTLEGSALGSEAILYGAAFLPLKSGAVLSNNFG